MGWGGASADDDDDDDDEKRIMIHKLVQVIMVRLKVTGMFLGCDHDIFLSLLL